MPSESTHRTYKLTRSSAFNTLQSVTGQAPIADINIYTVEMVDPNAPLGSRAWNIIGQGDQQPQFYDTQTYSVTDDDIASFVNNNAGTSFTASQIEDFRVGSDNSFFEIETT